VVAATPLSTEGPAGLEGAAATLTIRPEKIQLRPAGTGIVDGRVANRFFLGSHWLFVVATPFGCVTVSAPNLGEVPASEDDVVALHWAAASLRPQSEASSGAAA
jgi:putative spermidine/putrescine transport system ATP-binding protein